MKTRTHILPAPSKPLNIPSTSKWLSGEGCGSWFCIEKKQEEYIITRYNPEGKTECKGIFKGAKKFDINNAYEFTYLSHCNEVNIIQNNLKYTFTLKTKFPEKF